MSKDELKPCPFCGRENVYIDCRKRETGKGKIRMEAAIMCLDCKSRGPIVGSRDAAITAWNKREGGA